MSASVAAGRITATAATAGFFTRAACTSLTCVISSLRRAIGVRSQMVCMGKFGKAPNVRFTAPASAGRVAVIARHLLRD